MTSTPTPEQTDKLTLEGLMHLAMEMAALFRAAPRSLPGNCLAEYDAKKAQVRDYASRLIAQSAQETKTMNDGWRTSADGLTRTRIAPDAAVGVPASTVSVTETFPFFAAPQAAPTPSEPHHG